MYLWGSHVLVSKWQLNRMWQEEIAACSRGSNLRCVEIMYVVLAVLLETIQWINAMLLYSAGSLVADVQTWQCVYAQDLASIEKPF